MKQQHDTIDAAHNAFESLLGELPAFEQTLTTEADVRLKLLNTLLTDVLGWSKGDIATEEQAGKGYLDYKLAVDGVARVIVEAKRTARSFDLQGREVGSYKLSGPALKNADLQEGVRQAIEYSAYKGTELACVTNGFEWVIFRSNRIGDGTDTLEGKAFVFPSLEQIKIHFRDFHDLLAKGRVRNLSFRGLFQEAEGRIIRHPDFQQAVRPPSSAVFLHQAEIIPELDRIMTSFFQRLSNESDSEMIEFCFVETKESRAAEQRLLRLAEELVGHIRSLDTQSGAQLTNLLERVKLTNLNQFILLVGTKGAGKSTFIQRFFHSKLPPELRSACIPISLNLADTDGDTNTILEWLRRSLLAKAELALAGGGPPTWDEIVGHMFFGEYQRWVMGTMSHLYKRDKEQFKVEFGSYVESIRRDNPLEYIQGLLRNFVRARHQIPCLIFDNADHFSIEFQERVFQFARSLFEQELCVVIMPITDKTSWQLSQQGALQSFENEALLLPTPSAKRVLERRLAFVLKKMEDDTHRERGSYFIGKGIRVDVADMVKFVRGLQEVFLNSDKTAYALGQLANHDIREVLELSRDVVNSPHIGLDEAFKAYVLGSAVHIPEYKTRKALIRGRYDIHVAQSNKYVHNVFALNTELQTTPLLATRILQALKDAVVGYGSTKSRYTSKADLYSYMFGMGIERRAVGLWLDALLKRALVNNYDPTCVDEENATRLEISPAGEHHLFWGRGNYEYFAAMAEVTPILDEGACSHLRNACRTQGERRLWDVIRAFAAYLTQEDRLFCQVPDHESYRGQHNILGRFAGPSTRRRRRLVSVR